MKSIYEVPLRVGERSKVLVYKNKIRNKHARLIISMKGAIFGSASETEKMLKKHYKIYGHAGKMSDQSKVIS